MPTGYTAAVCEGEQSFTDFAISCAKAFGACLEQREDPLTTLPKPIAVSDYRTTSLANAIKELEHLRSLTLEQQLALSKKHSKDNVIHYKEQIAKKKIVRARIKKKLAETRAWKVPKSIRHVKEFMIKQLLETLDHDGDVSYYVGALAEVKTAGPNDYYITALDCAEKSVEYNQKALAEESNRVNEQHQWIVDFYSSLHAIDPEFCIKLLKQ